MAGLRAALTGALVAGAVLAGSAGGAVASAPPAPAPHALALSFTPNAGQVDRRVRYVAHAPGASLFFARRHVALALGGPGRRGAALHVRFVGADPGVRLRATGRAAGRASVLRGERRTWRRGLPAWRTLTYEGLWPGIDLVVRGTGGALKYAFHVAPGADPGVIRLAYAGSRSVRVAPDGGLAVATAAGTLRDAAPVSWQGSGARSVPVATRMRLGADGRTVGFTLGAYDRARPLVVDPELRWSTFLGGTGWGGLGVYEAGWGVASGPDGSAYVTGQTFAGDYPLTPGAFDTDVTGWTDAFVTRLSPTGSELVWSTVLGGTGPTGEEVAECQEGSAAGRQSDAGFAIAVDRRGSAYVTGRTDADDFPVTEGAYAETRGGTGCDYDAFVTKLTPSGADLEWSTYLGGGDLDQGSGLAVDRAGRAHVTGWTTSADFPTTPGAHDGSLGGDVDAFVTTLDRSGSALEASTLLGGGNRDVGAALALGGDGGLTVTGTTSSADFPARRALDPTLGGEADAFVARLSRRGGRVRTATFLGGAQRDTGVDVAVDALGRAAVTGATESADHPVTPGAFDTVYGGQGDAFVTVLGRSGSALVASTYLGGAGVDGGEGIAFDRALRPVVTGSTASPDFPVAPGALDATLNDGRPGWDDAFVTTLPRGAGSPVASTFLGGLAGDGATDLAVDRAGGVLVTGRTSSVDFPTTPDAFDPTFNEDPLNVEFGLYDIFVSRLGPA